MSRIFAPFLATEFMPHGFCYRWTPDVVWLNVISDGLIGVAYYSIPITLFYFVRKRRDFPLTWMLLMFGAFIVACGTTHLVEIWNVWNGDYRMAGVIKAMTALLSLSTAVLLLKVLPMAMNLQSPERLALINTELQREIAERTSAEAALKKSESQVRELNTHLERLVEERTSELRESEERLRAVFDQAAVGLAMVGLDGRWLRVNQRLCEIVGYTSDELLRMTFQKLTHPEDLDADLDQVRRLLAGEVSTYTLEKRYIRKDGSVVWIQLTVSLARQPAKNNAEAEPKYFISVVEDIAARRHAQEQLGRTVSELSAVKSALDEHAIVAITDPQGKITYVNDKFCAISKYPREELLGQDHRIINSGYHPKDFFRRLWFKIGRGQVWKGEICNRAKGGGIYWVDTTIVPYLAADGRPYQYVAIRADITQRKLAEESLFQLASIVDSSEDAIVSKRLDGTIVSWNAGAERLFGYSAMEVLGRSIKLIIPPERQAEEDELILRIARGERVQNVETVHRCKDGNLVDVFSSVSPVRDSEGRIVGASHIARDITMKKRSEVLTRESLREKETLLKEIHHRVKNNMQLISSLLQLQSRVIKDPDAVSVFRDGQNRIRSMALIHEKLYRSSNLASVDFAGYIHSLVAILLRTYNTASQRISVEVKIEDISLNLDTAVPLGLLLNELISNSLKHAFPEGRTGLVTVAIQKQPGDEMELTVSDNGIGLPADFRMEQSSSLGLRLIHILADQLQGNLEIQRQGGTVFRLRFKENKSKERSRDYAA